MTIRFPFECKIVQYTLLLHQPNSAPSRSIKFSMLITFPFQNRFAEYSQLYNSFHTHIGVSAIRPCVFSCMCTLTPLHGIFKTGVIAVCWSVLCMHVYRRTNCDGNCHMECKITIKMNMRCAWIIQWMNTERTNWTRLSSLLLMPPPRYRYFRYIYDYHRCFFVFRSLLLFFFHRKQLKAKSTSTLMFICWQFFLAWNLQLQNFSSDKQQQQQRQ